MKPRESKKILLIGVAAALVIGFIWLVAANGPMASIRVTAETAQIADLQSSLFGIGTVEAQRSYAIGPTAASRVKRVLVDVGDTVQAGQLVAEMDPVDLDDREAAARSAVERARHALNAADAQLRDASARQALANSNAERYVALGKQGFVSGSVVEGKQQEALSAQAGESAAHASLDAARQDLGRFVSEFAASQKLRGNLQLSAPVAGIVTARDAEPGTTLVAGQSVVRMVDPASIWIKARIDQLRSGGIKAGLPAIIVLRSVPNQQFRGKVERVEINSDSVTEERLVQVAFDKIPAGVSLGELVEVTIDLPKISSALTIPNAALRRIGDREGVWLIQDGELAFRPVRIGARSLDGMAQVLEGVTKDDHVVVHSERELKAGEKVKIVASLGKAGQ